MATGHGRAQHVRVGLRTAAAATAATAAVCDGAAGVTPTRFEKSPMTQPQSNSYDRVDWDAVSHVSGSSEGDGGGGGGGGGGSPAFEQAVAAKQQQVRAGELTVRRVAEWLDQADKGWQPSRRGDIDTPPADIKQSWPTKEVAAADDDEGEAPGAVCPPTAPLREPAATAAAAAAAAAASEGGGDEDDGGGDEDDSDARNGGSAEDEFDPFSLSQYEDQRGLQRKAVPKKPAEAERSQGGETENAGGGRPKSKWLRPKAAKGSSPKWQPWQQQQPPPPPPPSGGAVGMDTAGESAPTFAVPGLPASAAAAASSSSGGRPESGAKDAEAALNLNLAAAASQDGTANSQDGTGGAGDYEMSQATRAVVGTFNLTDAFSSIGSFLMADYNKKEGRGGGCARQRGLQLS
eukprot:SAG22_NODE_603_length_8633_cov_6.871455_4_plen_405_part_00